MRASASVRFWRCAFLFALGIVANAADGRGLIQAPAAPTHFQSRTWSEEDGAPRSPAQLAQSPDGYLWIASQEGLFRFDGVTFEEIRPPAGSPMEGAAPQTLLVSKKGEVWIGYSRGAGVAVYRGGQLVSTHFPNAPAVITNLVEVRDGSIWAEWGGLSRRIWRFQAGAWRQLDDELGLPKGYTLGMVSTPDGAIWVPVMAPDQHSSGIARLAPGARQFTWLGGNFQMPRLAVDRHGALWLTDRQEVSLYRAGGLQPPDRGIRYQLPLDLGLARLAFDRWDGIWGTTRKGDVFRIASAMHPAIDSSRQIEIFDKREWSSKSGAPLLVDGEGAIWLGLSGILQRYRFADVTMDPSVSADVTRGIKLTVASDGIVYALSNDTLFRVKPGEMAHALMKISAPMAMCAGAQGAVWVIGEHEVGLVDGGGTRRRLGAVPTPVAKCAEDGSSRLWIRGLDGSTWWRDARGWHVLVGYDAPGGNGVTVGVIANADGDVALASETPGMTVISGGRRTRYDFRPFGMDEIRVIDPAPHGFFAGGKRGLLSIRDGKVRKLDAQTYPWLANVSGIVQTDRGETWLRGPVGIIRTPTSELDRAFDRPGTPITTRLFDSRDGFNGGAAPFGFPTRTTVVGGDGRIWTITWQGLAVIDPAHLTETRQPPKVAIRSAETHPGLARDPVHLVLRPGTTTVRFVFAAMGLADPELVQIRYRLKGLESVWTDPGTRRATTYTNLSPGEYRFEVVAANAAGIWNRKGAAVDIEIRPTFVQSWPFKALCAVALLLLLWIAYRMRMHAVAAQIQARLAERHDERDRIARELHDTLLQSVQALILRLHLATEALPTDAPSRTDLEQTVVLAQKALAEGRERVRGLRSPQAPEMLEPALTKIASDRGFVPGSNLFVLTSGSPRRLDAGAASEILRIAEEALFNVARHAGATRTEVHIEYRANILQIIVRDNGAGIDPAVLRAGRREGHYGFVGMRERAGKLQGDMMFDTAAGGGAEIILMVPASIAYADAAIGWRGSLFRDWSVWARTLLRR